MWLLYLLPKRLLSRVIGLLARVLLPAPLARALIGIYVRTYRINLEEIEKPLDSFRSLAQFFVRELKRSSRPIGAGLVSPVDGVLRSFGEITEARIADVKGQDYGLSEFTGSADFSHGAYLNFYLSPRDCHHVFAPCDLRVVRTQFFPGTLWPVNDWAIRNIKRVFCRNERWVAVFDCEYGQGALAMVGAFNVGGIRLSERVRRGESLKKGEHFGTFELGSSVVLIFSARTLPGAIAVGGGDPVRYGMSLLK